jgi:hypothetical protein
MIRPQHYAAMFVVACLVLGVPFYMAKNLQLGSYAKSPQEVEMSLGSTALIGGGRAHLWYAGGDTGGDFEVRCRTERRYFQPEIGETYEACKVSVELLKIQEPDGGRPPRARFRVTWKR